jgi:hypothetical protein
MTEKIQNDWPGVNQSDCCNAKTEVTQQLTNLTEKQMSATDPAILLTKPEFLRLPKSPHHCPYTGMSRSALNALILPTKENKFKPSVRSFILRQRGAKTGIRLIDYASLVSHI